MEDRPRRKRGRPAKRSRVLRERIDEYDGKRSYSPDEMPIDSTDITPTFPPEESPTFKSNPLQLDVDITTLGTRTETRMVEKPVLVGKTDLGKDVITMKMKPETVTKLQPILNLEEALSLSLFGIQNWQPFPPKQGHWFCHVEQKGQRRRFLIPDDVYREIQRDR